MQNCHRVRLFFLVGKRTQNSRVPCVVLTHFFNSRCVCVGCLFLRTPGRAPYRSRPSPAARPIHVFLHGSDDGGPRRRRLSPCRSLGGSSDPAPAGAPRCHGVACGVSCNDALTNTESFFTRPLCTPTTCIASRPRRHAERPPGSARVAVEAAWRGRRRR